MSARSGHIWLEPDFCRIPPSGASWKRSKTGHCSGSARSTTAVRAPTRSGRTVRRDADLFRAADENVAAKRASDRIRRANEPQAPRKVTQVREYIDRHYARPLTIGRLARLAGLSPYHFIRAFRAHAGQTPHQYLRARRIERAKELLITTPMPVTEICDAVGFQSLGSFSSLFRKLTGETPAAFRAARRRSVRIPTCFVRMYRADR
jgi:AraC-like DNA-binding protein